MNGYSEDHHQKPMEDLHSRLLKFLEEHYDDVFAQYQATVRLTEAQNKIAEIHERISAETVLASKDPSRTNYVIELQKELSEEMESARAAKRDSIRQYSEDELADIVLDIEDLTEDFRSSGIGAGVSGTSPHKAEAAAAAAAATAAAAEHATEVKELQADLKAVAADLKASKSREAVLSAKIAELEDTTRHLQDKLTNRIAEISRLRDLTEEQESDIDSLRRSNEKLQQQLRDLEKQQQQQQQQIHSESNGTTPQVTSASNGTSQQKVTENRASDRARLAMNMNMDVDVDAELNANGMGNGSVQDVNKRHSDSTSSDNRSSRGDFGAETVTRLASEEGKDATPPLAKVLPSAPPRLPPPSEDQVSGTEPDSAPQGLRANTFVCTGSNRTEAEIRKDLEQVQNELRVLPQKARRASMSASNLEDLGSLRHEMLSKQRAAKDRMRELVKELEWVRAHSGGGVSVGNGDAVEDSGVGSRESAGSQGEKGMSSPTSTSSPRQKRMSLMWTDASNSPTMTPLAAINEGGRRESLVTVVEDIFVPDLRRFLTTPMDIKLQKKRNRKPYSLSMSSGVLDSGELVLLWNKKTDDEGPVQAGYIRMNEIRHIYKDEMSLQLQITPIRTFENAGGITMKDGRHGFEAYCANLPTLTCLYAALHLVLPVFALRFAPDATSMGPVILSKDAHWRTDVPEAKRNVSAFIKEYYPGLDHHLATFRQSAAECARLSLHPPPQKERRRSSIARMVKRRPSSVAS
eukprot:Rmarinus@m.9472